MEMCDSIRNCQEQQIQKHRMLGHFTVKSNFSGKAFKYRVHPQENETSLEMASYSYNQVHLSCVLRVKKLSVFM